MAQDDLRVMISIALINEPTFCKRIFMITVAIVDSRLIVRGVLELPDFPDSQIERTYPCIELFINTSILVASNPARVMRGRGGVGIMSFEVGLLVIAPVVISAHRLGVVRSHGDLQ